MLAGLLLGCSGEELEKKAAAGPPPPPPPPPADSCAPLSPTSSQTFNVMDAAYGAVGDGVADDTAALQRAINAAAGTGGTVVVPDGTYLVNPTAVASSGNHAIQLRNNMTFRMSSGTIIKAKPTSASTYTILMVSAVSNVQIIGGTIVGERYSHIGTGGESGMCVGITDSQHVKVQGVTAREGWGDGFYVGGDSSDISLCGVTADANRRAGISITRVSGLSVRNSVFSNTGGTLPESGLNVEPNAGETANQVVVDNCIFQGNRGGGIQVGPALSLTGSAFVYRVVIQNCQFTGNGVGAVDGGSKASILVSNCDGTQVKGNQIQDNSGRGILLRDQATNSLIYGNLITRTVGNPGDGIYLSKCDGSDVTANTVTNNLGHGIYVVAGAGANLGTNSVSGNGKTP